MEDPRFARVAQDPRFEKIPRKEKKLKIDGRFQKMFTDKEFTTKYFVDKRGSKVEKTSTEDLHKFYELSDESDEEEVTEEQPKKKETVKDIKTSKSKTKTEEKRKKKKKIKQKLQVTVSDSESSDEDVSQVEQKRTKDEQEDQLDSDEEVDFGRGEGNVASSSDEENEEELTLEIQQEDVEHPWGEMDISAKTTQEATRRLALCNVDWDRVTATDLFVMFNSFKPRDGVIQSIKIYPSEYGLEQMKKEECNGPTELREEENEEFEKGVEGKEGSEFSMEKLRQYQLNRLKYYYAVIECNSPETAEILYEECDGTEFELSGNTLDLRFIPDEMEFEHEPHSVSTELPASGSYTAPDFSTTALHQTSVKLTWDENDPGRQRATMRKFKKEDLLDMDFNAYLASSSDEDELEKTEQLNESDNGDSSEDEDRKIDKYKRLLKEIEDKEHKSDRDQELEITWEPGLQETREELVTRKIQEKETKTMTPWETYLKKKKEKRKEKQMGKDVPKKQLSGNASDESDEVPSDVDLSDPFFSGEIDAGLKKGVKVDRTSGKSKKKGKFAEKETTEDKKSKEELELLLMEDGDDRQHFSLKGILENEKKSKKKRKRKLKEEAVVADDSFNVDLEDSRFNALFTSHHFAVDPSDPQYRKTKAMDTILEERQKRRHDTEGKNKSQRYEKEFQSQTRDPSLSLLVKSIKSKTGQFQEQKKKRKMK